MIKRLSAAHPVRPGRPARAARRVIDAHGHLLVPEANALAEGHPREAADAAAERAAFSAASVEANQAQLRRVWPQLTDVGRRLADLDAIGVDVQVVGPMPMHRYWAEPELAVKLTTVVNEAVAAHCAHGQGRLHGLGTLPLQHPAIAVRWASPTPSSAPPRPASPPPTSPPSSAATPPPCSASCKRGNRQAAMRGPRLPRRTRPGPAAPVVPDRKCLPFEIE